MTQQSASVGTRELGTTGMEITRVGFGAWAIGGGGWKFGWGSQDDDESLAAIRYGVEQGVNWIDTAPVYGLGRSEEVVGRAVRDFPENDRPFIFTKCGLIFDAERPEQAPKNILAPESIRTEVEASLRRLGVERIDLYQVHWPPQDGTSLHDYWSTLVDLRQEGKVRAIGFSNHDVAALSQAEAIGHVDSLQPPFSMIHREAAEELLPWCADNSTGVIVYSPMQSGLLTGKMSAERIQSLPADDWRSSHSDFTGEALHRNLALADGLRPIAERHGVGVPVIAVAWALAWRGVTSAIVGARNPEQVKGWLPAATLELTSEDYDELAELIRTTEAGEGPIDPTKAG
ncbi:MAG TPA: aldo/keto reductase [Micromonosporaceae bacterium]|nr:aldo/keto reductase [Micromonosporaceae bacterium]